MEKSVGALDAHHQPGKILADVSSNGDHYIVNLHGEPVALYQRWKRRREAFFDTLDELATTADLAPRTPTRSRMRRCAPLGNAAPGADLTETPHHDSPAVDAGKRGRRRGGSPAWKICTLPTFSLADPRAAARQFRACFG